MEEIIKQIQSLFAEMKSKDSLLSRGIEQLQKDQALVESLKKDIAEREAKLMPFEDIEKAKQQLAISQNELSQNQSSLNAREIAFNQMADKAKSDLQASIARVNAKDNELAEKEKSLNASWIELNEEKAAYKDKIKLEVFSMIGK